ncbi:MAG: hypothetical protein JWP04_1061 [Belnapia sp.]|nr:hypothetical protein [Belnapia sp.]
MDEPKRLARNQQRLAECHPRFAVRLQRAIAMLEKRGFRPRIQEAWRSKADQQIAFDTGHSKLQFGYHNGTGPNGEKLSLAVDLLEDDDPLDPPIRYVLALAIDAGKAGLGTGALWARKGAPPLTGAKKAIETGNIEAKVNVGWDPCHVEVVGVSLDKARAGDFSEVR